MTADDKTEARTLFADRLRKTELIAMRFATRFEKTLRKLGIVGFVNTPDSMVRLLNLRGAMLKHRLTLPEILEILFTKYRTGKGAASNRLGVSLKVLTGQAAMKYLSFQVRKRYPNNEQVKSWRSRKIQILTAQSFNPELPETMEDFPEQYSEAISDHRERTARASERRRLRRYRNSPWI